MRGYSGGITISDCNNPSDRVTVELHPGSLTFDASCTAGIMVARGVGEFVNAAVGATVLDETVKASAVDLTRKLSTNRVSVSADNAVTTIYEDDAATPLLIFDHINERNRQPR
jgi:hypothetical protein